MTRKFVAWLSVVLALGTLPSVALAADSQSLHFRAQASATGGSLGAHLRARNNFQVDTDVINLQGNDAPATVALRVAKALCLKSFSQYGNLCTITVPATCDAIDPLDASTNVIFTCKDQAFGVGFQVSRTPAPTPDAVGASAVPLPGGNVSNMNCENRNSYNDIGNDIAGRTLLQVRPNTITGTIQLKIYHTQGGANPRIASVSVDSTRASDTQALHNAIRDALNGISPALNPAIVATTHPSSDATAPLTAFSTTLQQASFVEITNNRTVGITEVEAIVVQGQGLTVEGTENAFPLPVPAVSRWGMVFLAVMLLLSGYWLMHRRRAGTTTA